ncbi:response regulator transcription factor [Pseudonocardia bannensis]|uniref:Response regulator transcription factor n=1 Tax=Pseudonocardia bannensis TaxID=630973 RepID=A0A848DJU1_9PSEU|nr:LuxR C-terminal-related transcriptional regulator [Pseudonocardia bannensis]NMH92977.1 response regulator transcription factor [Pseudonocardia bannensis]
MSGAHPEILVVDDHVLVSSAIAMALGARGLTAHAISPDELAGRMDTPAPPGGLVLLDLDLGGGLDGVGLVPRLRRVGWRLLVVTGSTDEVRIASAVAAGALGWIPKTAPFDELVDTAVRAAEGRSLMGGPERERLARLAEEAARESEARRERWRRLTPREQEIVGHIAAGRRPAAIAAECVVSVATVRTQVRSILAKLEVGSQLEIAALARDLQR